MKKIYHFFKILAGYIIAANGSILATNGFIYIYEFIALCIKKKINIFETRHYRVIGYVSHSFGYLLGLTFVIAGIYAISIGAKMVGVSQKSKRKPTIKFKPRRKAILPYEIVLRYEKFSHR